MKFLHTDWKKFDFEISLDNKMSVREVIATNVEFGECNNDNIKKFSVRLSNARKAVRTSLAKAAADRTVIEHDVEVLLSKQKPNLNKKPTWYLSKAADLLRQDVKDKVNERMKPLELYNLRSEYKEFDVKVFR